MGDCELERLCRSMLASMKSLLRMLVPSSKVVPAPVPAGAAAAPVAELATAG